MPVKRPIYLTVFGILSIGCGLLVLYGIVNYLLSKPWAELDNTPLDYILLECNFEKWIMASCVMFAFILVAGFLISGYGIFRVKPWSRYLLLLTTGLYLWGLVNRVILLGPCIEELFYISRFFVGGLFIWFFNRKSVRTVFPYLKGLKVLMIVWIVVIAMEFLGAGIYWYRNFGPYFLKLEREQAVYQPKDDSFYSRDYFRSPFPLKYSLAIPNGFTISGMLRVCDLGIWIDLIGGKNNPITGWISIRDQRFLQEDYSQGKLLGYGTPYRFYQKTCSEWYGLYFVVFKMWRNPIGMYRIEEVEIDGLRGFLKKGKIIKEGRDKNSWGSVYFLFQGHEAIGEGDIVLWGPDNQRVDDIISSIRPQDKPQKTAGDFFQEGKILLHRKEFEKAKFSFVSALCLDWENPQYHYYLGRAFFETENWFSAKQHLEEAMSFQPHYPEAQQLLNEVKNKETSEKQ